MPETLKNIIADIADALVYIDSSGKPFRGFKPGIGPYGEPQLLKEVREILNDLYQGKVVTRRNPDLLIKGSWALEFKIVRPFGDNGIQAENWSVNLLHPYEGNVSALGDCLKLLQSDLPERKAVIVIGYEHTPPNIPLEPLVESFEILADKIMKIRLGVREVEHRSNLIHPVHQQLTVYSWEVLGWK